MVYLLFQSHCGQQDCWRKMTTRRRHFAIFTTASLPWMTGTAINPLFRAAYLAKDGDRDVTLIIPWLSFKDQDLVYPNKIKFNVPSEQEDYVRKWLQERTAMVPSFTITFYPGKVSSFFLLHILLISRLVFTMVNISH